MSSLRLTALSTTLFLAQTAPIDAAGWGLDAIARVGLGVASFAALLLLVRWLTNEIKESRTAFVAELRTQHLEHAKEVDEIHARYENRDEKIREKLHGLTNAIQAHGFDAETRRSKG